MADELSLDKALRSAKARGVKIDGSVAMAWFTKESWPRLLEIAADRDNLPDTFERFLQIAGGRFDALVAQGHVLEKVIIDVDRLAAFCHQHGKPVDRNARAMFALVTKREQEANAGHA